MMIASDPCADRYFVDITPSRILGGVIIITNRKQDDGGLHLLNVHTGTKLMRPPARANYIEQR